MKLEIKHLAAYLPYGLKVLHTDWNTQLNMTTTGSDNDDFSIDDVPEYAKPILRPLSDLTKEIEHNGEKFTPCYWFGRQGINIDSIKDERWHIVQRLISWHFDIHGLIDNGLAIDINTIYPS